MISWVFEVTTYRKDLMTDRQGLKMIVLTAHNQSIFLFFEIWNNFLTLPDLILLFNIFVAEASVVNYVILNVTLVIDFVLLWKT